MTRPLRVGLLVHEPSRSGGMGVIAAHASALLDDPRFAPELVLTAAEPAEAELAGVPVRSLAAAAASPFDICVATWWQTAEHLFELEASTRVVLLQSLEDRFYPEQDLFERIGARAITALPVHYLVVAGWLRDVIAEIRPGARCLVVRNGIDKTVFAPAARRPAGGRLRVLVEGQPTLWFKGVREASAAVRAMREPATLTLVAATPEGLEEIDADRRESGLDPAGMAALYAEHDVLLKLSRVESLGLPALEALHVGRPVVLAPYTGHEEYAEHDRNCLIVGHDDERGTAAVLDQLAGGEDLLERLGRGAGEIAETWPSRGAAGGAFREALFELHSGPAPDAADAARHAARLARSSVELGRHYTAQVGGLLAWREHELADTRAHLDDVNRDRDELAGRIEAMRAERAYRLAARLRRLLPGRSA